MKHLTFLCSLLKSSFSTQCMEIPFLDCLFFKQQQKQPKKQTNKVLSTSIKMQITECFCLLQWFSMIALRTSDMAERKLNNCVYSFPSPLHLVLPLLKFSFIVSRSKCSALCMCSSYDDNFLYFNVFYCRSHP